MMKSEAGRNAGASNLLWRWASHRNGEKAFTEAFPTHKCVDPLWQVMQPVIYDRYGHGFRTYTDRLRVHLMVNDRIVSKDLSPASITMIQYSAARYSVENMPKVTRGAMTGWLNERSHLFYDFGRLFDDDEEWHPYQVCLRAAQGDISALKKALAATWNPPADPLDDEQQAMKEADEEWQKLKAKGQL